MAKGAALLLLSLAAGAGATAASSVGECRGHGSERSADHVLLQASRGDLTRSAGKEAGDGETCSTSEPGEQCYAAATWAKKHGIKLHPEWYPGLKPYSSLEEFQALLSKHGEDECETPCNLCQTATEGDNCHSAVTWAMEHGIRLHPDWYIGLLPGSSFEEFQAHLHFGGHSSCPMPCNLCRSVAEGEECYTDLAWAMEHGIKMHPKWYPGLTESSSKEEFQGFMHTKRTCPPPCGECRTAAKGESCFKGVEWAKKHGVHLHPEWYPELTADSTFEEFQNHLHESGYHNCPRPCM